MAASGVSLSHETTDAQPWTAYHTPESVRREFLPTEHVERRPLLDKPSDPHPILNYLLHEALTRILLVSDGAISSYTAPLEIVKGTVDRTDALQRALADAGPYTHAGRVKGTQEPISELASVIDRFHADYGKCRTHRQRIAVIKDAQFVAVRLRYAPDRSQVHGTREWREAIAHDPRDTVTIAFDHGITDRTVRNIRKEFGTNRPHGGDHRKRLASREQGK